MDITNDSDKLKDLYDFCKNPKIKYCNLRRPYTGEKFTRYILDIPYIKTYGIDLLSNVPRDVVTNMFLKELAKDINFENMGEVHE